jgi:hypothetical protein
LLDHAHRAARRARRDQGGDGAVDQWRSCLIGVG